MNRLHNIQRALLAQRILEELAERLLLLVGGNRPFGIEQRADHVVVGLCRIAQIEQRVVDVGLALVERREHEARLRHIDDVVQRAGVELVLAGAIAQRRLAQTHRTDRADQIMEHVRARVGRLIVQREGRHVVGIVHEQYQIVVLEFERLDDVAEELLHRFVVGQRRIAQLHQQRVLRALPHLLGRKRHIHEVLVRYAGERLFEDRQILVGLLLRHGQRRGGEFGYDLAVLIDIAAANHGHIVALGIEALANFGNFFSGHDILLYDE